MSNMKKWIFCALLFVIGILILRFLDKKQTVEEYRGGGHGIRGRGHGGRGGYYGGIGRGGYYGGRGGYYGGSGYYGGVTPIYIYDDSNYNSYPYWYRYIPFFSYYYN